VKAQTDSAGVSLTELLVALLILSLLAGGLHQFYLVMSRSVALLAAASEAEEGARIAIEVMQRDLRSAGFSPDGSLDTGVLVAEIDSVRIARDLNGDHDTNDASERVAYSLDREGHRLMRRMGNASPQPMLNDMAEDGLVFAYRTDGGEELRPAEGNLPAEDRKRIRRIDIMLALELPNPNPKGNRPIRSQQTATVSLRNEPTKVP
jgi:prepilin-type N-terminal cleavage/methylation domain-containing protein